MFCSLTCLIIFAFILIAVVILSLIFYLFGISDLESFIDFISEIKKQKNLFSAIFRTDEESRNHGGMLVADVLQSHGVDTIYTLCGGHISPILVACEAKNIKVVDTRHEASAVFAADAHARLGCNIGVVAVTAGPGLTNTVTAIKNAQMAESPVLLLGGAAATLLKGRGALQDIDQMVLFKPLCKYVHTITRVRDIVPVLRRAIKIAKSGTPGPVFVEFPIDTLYSYHLVQRELGQKENATKFMDKLVNNYLQFHISRLFGKAWLETRLVPKMIEYPLPDEKQIDKAAALLVKSKCPLILVGSQAMSPPVAPQDLQQAMNELAIPCYLGGMARGLMGDKCKLQFRHQRKTALKEADLVILAGTVCDFRLSYGRVLRRGCDIISINRDKIQLTKNSDMFWKPTIAAQSDVASFIVMLAKRVKSLPYTPPNIDGSWIEALNQREQDKEQNNEEMSREVAEKHVNPLNVMFALEKVLPQDTILVADGGDFVATAAYTLRPRGPLQWLDPGAFGTLGVGGGFALAAKICKPESPVWIIYGDGSYGYSMAEIDTYFRHKTPVTCLIGNDACWSQICREQLPIFGSSVACDLHMCDYEKSSEGLGAVGLRLDDTNVGQMEEVFKRALQLNKQGKSVVINVLTAKSKFREGSISV